MKYALLALALVGCTTAAPAPTPTPAAEAPPALRLPADVRPTGYRLALEVLPARPRFGGAVEIDVELQQARATLWLHGKDLAVSKAVVRAGGKEVAAVYKQVNADGLASLTLPAPVGPGPATLRLEYDAPFGDRNDGLYKVPFGGDVYAVTQFEAISARMTFPCFDEPGLKAPLELELTVAAADAALSNMPAAAEEPLPDGRKRVRFARTPPLSAYLYAWAVGPFEVVAGPVLPPTPVRAQPLPVRGVAPRGHGKELADALALSGPTLAALEDYFGMAFPYPKLDLVAVPDFWAGAMENPGLITFRDSLLLFREETAPLWLRKFATTVEAHEMAHQWFGDLVTLAWWDEIWLNEAFANWLELPIAERVRPELGFPMVAASRPSRAMGRDALTAARSIRQPVLTTGDIQNGFDAITYDKGSAVIRMFERYVGPDAFRAGVRAYMKAHAQGTATADDLLTALGQAAGRDVAGPFHTFLDQPGVPLVEARLECQGGPARLLLRQRRYLPVGSTGDPKATWRVPVCARYPSGGKVAQACTLLEAEQGELALPGPGCPAWVHPNPDNAGYYRWSLPGPQLAALSAARLEGPDRFSLADNVAAGVDAAVVPYGDALAALSPLARDPEPQVSEPLRGLLDLGVWRLAGEAQRPAAQRLAAALLRPVLAEAGLARKAKAEDPRLTQRRADAVALLAGTAEDPKVRAELAALGRTYLPDPAGPAHPEAVEPSLVAAAMRELLRAEPARFDALAERLKTEQNPAVRAAVLGALTTAPEVSAKALELSLDPRLRSNEVLEPLEGARGDVRTAPAGWAWFKAHYDALLPKLADEDRAYLPGLARGLCTEAEARDVEAFFTPRLDKLPGAPRSLKQTLEGIRLCAALVAAQREPGARYLTDHAPK